MNKKLLVTGIAAFGLAATPVMAEIAAPATQPVTGENELAESGSAVALALIAGVLAVAVLAITNGGNDGDDAPISA